MMVRRPAVRGHSADGCKDDLNDLNDLSALSSSR